MSASKAAKLITFTAKASESHNAVKVKNVIKWLKSGHEVRVQISGKADRHKAMEEIYDKLQNDFKSGAKFLQKAVRPDMIKVTLVPTSEAADLVVPEKDTKDVGEEIEELVGDNDVFSGDFEKELSESIQKEMSKNKKK